jgi:hypothetical protein
MVDLKIFQPHFYAPRIEVLSFSPLKDSAIRKSGKNVMIDGGVEFQEGISESWSITHSQFLIAGTSPHLTQASSLT